MANKFKRKIVSKEVEPEVVIPKRPEVLIGATGGFMYAGGSILLKGKAPVSWADWGNFAVVFLIVTIALYVVSLISFKAYKHFKKDKQQAK